MAKSNFLQEFKAFAMKGNVVDMAVGVIIGGAFGKIVSSLVADIVMPVVGLMVGGIDFTDMKYIMSEAVTDAEGNVVKEAVSLNYGVFIQNTVDFLIIALAIFLVIKGISKLQRQKEEEPAAPAPAPEPSKEEVLLAEIRDLLKEQSSK